MQLHELQSNQSKKKRVGRGGKRGKTSGHGHKGQKARAGGSPRPEMRDIIKKIPKLRGHGKNRAKTVNDARIVYAVVNVGTLGEVFKAGEIVTPEMLLEKGLVSRSRGKTPRVKILAGGDIKTKITVSGCTVSKAAREKITKAGGVIEE